jgi:G3E family GTPase
MLGQGLYTVKYSIYTGDILKGTINYLRKLNIDMSHEQYVNTGNHDNKKYSSCHHHHHHHHHHHTSKSSLYTKNDIKFHPVFKSSKNSL